MVFLELTTLSLDPAGCSFSRGTCLVFVEGLRVASDYHLGVVFHKPRPRLWLYLDVASSGKAGLSCLLSQL